MLYCQFFGHSHHQFSNCVIRLQNSVAPLLVTCILYHHLLPLVVENCDPHYPWIPVHLPSVSYLSFFSFLGHSHRQLSCCLFCLQNSLVPLFLENCLLLCHQILHLVVECSHPHYPWIYVQLCSVLSLSMFSFLDDSHGQPSSCVSHLDNSLPVPLLNYPMVRVL